MIEERQKAFYNYIEEYKKLSIQEKKDEFIVALKELFIIFEGFAESDNIKVDLLKSKEVVDLKSNSVSEDDYLEAVMSYLEIAKDVMGQYLMEKFSLLEDNNENSATQA